MLGLLLIYVEINWERSTIYFFHKSFSLSLIMCHVNFISFKNLFLYYFLDSSLSLIKENRYTRFTFRLSCQSCLMMFELSPFQKNEWIQPKKNYLWKAYLLILSPIKLLYSPFTCVSKIKYTFWASEYCLSRLTSFVIWKITFLKSVPLWCAAWQKGKIRLYTILSSIAVLFLILLYLFCLISAVIMPPSALDQLSK